jgi:murein DD-endopeptidase MepM/ murein hydrolase activator NlpD
MKRFLAACGLILGVSSASAEPALVVTPTSVHPGDAVVVSVLGATALPHGKAGGVPLHFFAAKRGFQAVFAAPLEINEDHILVEVTDGPAPLSVAVVRRQLPESKVIVEDELANPPKEERERIDADNGAIGASYAKADGSPQFVHPFRRPPGAVTSTFGEWRTFNDGHRSQHLGLDLGEGEGTKVRAVNSGTVVLVRTTFLAGNVVVLAHGAGITSMYFHLARSLVAEGDAVTQDTPIGLVGHTGRTTGPHLHLSIHVAGGMVDPATFLALPLAPATPPATARK